MIESSRLNKDFIQSTISCVLSSYAVVNNYFSGLPIETHFQEYCKHFGLRFSDAKDAETKYEHHFDMEWRKRGCKGYEIILDLHQNSSQNSFTIGRTKFHANFYLSTTDHLEEINNSLMSKEAIINLTYQHSMGYHSVTVFYDKGLMLRDTNKKGVVGISNLTSLGNLRDSMLYVKVQ